MKKLVGIIGVLVIVLGGLLLFNFSENGKETKKKEEVITTLASEEEKPVASNETYQYQDIESMEKANSIKEAFERIFGKDRLFDDLKDNDSYNGEIKYYLQGVYKTENEYDMFKYYPEKKYIFEFMDINITMKPGFDTRIEMIDFLHYLQFSGLTKPEFIKEVLPEDSVELSAVHQTAPEEIPPFNIHMEVFQQIKPGMNTPESHQGWLLSSQVIEVMDFSDKEDILNSIHMYGKFEGVNPSGMK